jgi:crossover junction endodeoxyribonuclease RusA
VTTTRNRILCTIEVHGVPAPQGSFKHVGRGRIIPTNAPTLYKWRELVAAHASMAYDAEPYDGAVGLFAIFVLPAPKRRRVRPLHDRRPDLDKLLRAVGDAVTGVVITDDARIARMDAVKLYGDTPRALLTVVALDATDTAPA